MGSYAEVFEADTFASVTTFATGARGNPVLVDPVGNQVWVGNPDSRSVTVVERGTHNTVITLTGFQNPHSIVQDPDTGSIYVADHSAGAGLVYVIEASTLSTLGTVAIANPYQLKVSADATEVAVPGYGDRTLTLLDSATGTVLTSAAACTGATDVSEDTATGRWVVTGATRSGLEVLECR